MKYEIFTHTIEYKKSKVYKAIITLITLFFSINTFAQKVDLINAPMNPIALKYKKEHFNLKGDVFQHDSKYFSKEGNLLRNTSTGEKYTYEAGKLTTYDTNDKGYVIKKNNIIFAYNSKGLLTSMEEAVKQPGKADIVNRSKYEYDNLERLITEHTIKNGSPTTTRKYTYKKNGDILQVTEAITEGTKEPYQTEQHYKNGRLIYSKSSNDVIELKILSKLDAKGNSTKDDYINSNTKTNKSITDQFDYTIVYYDEAKKQITYTVVLKKGYGNKRYQHIYKNGLYFSSSLKHQIALSNDLIYYDELTQTYYLAKDAYNISLPENTIIKAEVISKGNPVLLCQTSEASVMAFNNGENTLAKVSAKTVKTFNNKVFIYYTENYTRQTYTLCFPYEKNKKFTAGEQLGASADNYYNFYDSENDEVIFIKNGSPLEKNTLSGYGETEKGELVAFVNNKPYYKFPDYRVTETDKVFPAKFYDPKIDKLKEGKGSTIPSSTNSGKTTVSKTTTSTQASTPKDLPIDKITATFSAGAPLLVRKVDDATFHFYQYDKRISPPLRLEVITKGSDTSGKARLDLFCSYGANYNFYCPHDVKDIEKNALYSMYQNKEINYLYVYQNNVGILSLNYHNVMLDKKEYEVYSPKGNDNFIFIKTKKDNDFFVADKKQLSKYRKSVLKSINVPHSQNYLMILQNDNEFVYLEMSKPTLKKGWRMEHIADDKYFLINDKEKIKLYGYNYDKLLKQGFEYLRKDQY